MIISTAKTRKSTTWVNENLTWAEMVTRLKDVIVKTHTHAQYKAAGKDEQAAMKDVGGYVGGPVEGGKRKKGNVNKRWLVALDADFPGKGSLHAFDLMYGNAAFRHTTHSHHVDSERYRLLIPLDRAVTPDEYQAVARRVASNLGMAAFDETTFEANRLMFWPSMPADVPYEFVEFEGPLMSADEVLSSYKNWKDVSEWPVADNSVRVMLQNGKRQQDPTEKTGYIGQFCRAYNIPEVIESYLSDVYTPAGEGRYTYVGGTTYGGLVLYDDDTFAYSHHSTDPASGTLNNAFDLVLRHKFTGDEAHAKMRELVLNDPKVQKLRVLESDDFKMPLSEPVEVEPAIKSDARDDMSWLKNLEANKAGTYLSSATNIAAIFQNDPNLKSRFKYNIFDRKTYIFGPLPWRKMDVEFEPIRNVDYAGLRIYLEKVYRIHSVQKVDDAVAVAAEVNAYHPVREYLNSSKWDGVPRIESILPKYLGSEDSAYTREVMRKVMVGAVARAFNPGVKFDYCLALSGPQGCGKSTFVRKLSNGWYTDSFYTVQGTSAFEQVQGNWFVEAAELSGFRKAEVEAVKHFISKQEDTYRPAYGRTTETYKRQCVFIVTTNDDPFLKDSTGDRRFLPVSVGKFATTASLEDIEPQELSQLWAEAVHLWKAGEKLTLSAEIAEVAATQQSDFKEIDSRQGLIQEFLDKDIPTNWDEISIEERKLYFSGAVKHPAESLKRREYLCTAEIWCECFGKVREDFDRFKTRDVNELMRAFPEWEAVKKTKKFGNYGYQRYFKRK